MIDEKPKVHKFFWEKRVCAGCEAEFEAPSEVSDYLCAKCELEYMWIVYHNEQKRIAEMTKSAGATF